MSFKPSDKMCDLICKGPVAEYGHSSVEEQVLQLMNRFGISMGIGELSIAKVCANHQVNCDTFLAIVNYAIHRDIPTQLDIDIPTLHRYLENAHTYFLQFQLPRIRQELLEAINLAQTSTQVPLMIIQFFDEYAQEIKAHIDHEAEHSYEQHARDDEHIANKAHELKTLIIKYYPRDTQNSSSEQMRLLYAALHDLRHFENELALHCAIEDNIMLPALRKEVKSKEGSNTNDTEDKEDNLSAREIEVVKYVAQGLSNKEIAAELFLGEGTVRNYISTILDKLELRDRTQLVVYYYKNL